jgi:hypothetical protein
MARQRPTLALGLAAMLLLAGGALAQDTRFSLDFGYQWLSIDGNEDLYRSQVNQDDGFVVRDFHLSNLRAPGDVTGWDRLVIDAAGLGASPYGYLRAEMSRARDYSLRLSYTRAEHFSALPALANPFIDDGIYPGQHTFDRTSDEIDLNLELLPGRAVTPIVGYRYYQLDGPGSTTFAVGQDEFQLNENYEYTVQELRAGLAFNLGRFTAAVLQGWREIEATQQLALAPGAEDGNNANPVLGQDITMSSYSRTSTTNGTSPMTHVYLSGLIGKGLRVYGTYARADQESRYEEAESLSGDLASFKISRFFSGRDEVAAAKAQADDWRGQLRVEAALGSNFDLVLGYDERHRALDGTALVESLYTGVSTFGGFAAPDVSRILDADTLGDRQEEQLSARLIARVGRPLTVWAEWASADQDILVEPDASEIVIAGNQGGSFERSLDRLAAGATLKFGHFDLGVDWLSDEADTVVMRTDYLDRERVRGRIGFTMFKWLRLSGTIANISAETAIPGIDSDTETDQLSVDLDVTPSENFNARVSYSTYDTDSTITVRVPHDLSLEPSLYLAEGELWDVALNGKVAWCGVTFGWSSYDNTGSFGFDFEHALVRLDFDFSKRVGLGLLAESYDYQEEVLAEIGDYLVKRYGVFLRLHN